MKPKTAQQQMADNLIVKMLAGSHAYGTSTPTSDVDYRGIFVADPLNVRTPFYFIGEVEDSSEEDTKIFELNKFMKLALECNPNIIELLWTRNEDIVFCTPAYDLLRQHAGQLLSSKLAFTFSGYATSQIKRLKGSKRNVDHLPDLKKLCEVLKQAMSDNLIDEAFIRRECGEDVLNFMTSNGYLL